MYREECKYYHFVSSQSWKAQLLPCRDRCRNLGGLHSHVFAGSVAFVICLVLMRVHDTNRQVLYCRPFLGCFQATRRTSAEVEGPGYWPANLTVTSRDRARRCLAQGVAVWHIVEKLAAVSSSSGGRVRRNGGSHRASLSCCLVPHVEGALALGSGPFRIPLC